MECDVGVENLLGCGDSAWRGCGADVGVGVSADVGVERVLGCECECTGVGVGVEVGVGRGEGVERGCGDVIGLWDEVKEFRYVVGMGVCM